LPICFCGLFNGRERDGERKASILLCREKSVNQNMQKKKMVRKTTDEIRTILKNAELDFDVVENRALNDYLSKILHSCPFTKEVCTTNQCQECSVFKKTLVNK
jgi:hypothetical protein